MNTLPRVSVVLPVFNGAATLSDALESIHHQVFLGWELIVVDDGSTDGATDWLKRWARSEPRARVISGPHRGIVHALNIGLEEARGEFIARMDADDVSHPDRLGEQMDRLVREQHAGLVGCLVEFGGDRRTAAGYALHVDWINSLVTAEEIALNRFIESPFAHPSVLFRRELIERCGGYVAGDFPEDYDLWLRWLEAGVRMVKVPRVLLTWNDPPQRLSRTDLRYDAEAFFRCKAGYLARWIQAEVAAERRILVWGAGRPTRKRARPLSAHGINVTGYIDIDPRKVGRSIGGLRVLAPEDIPPPGEVFVLGYVAKRGARELARGHLRSRGFVEGRDFLMVA